MAQIYAVQFDIVWEDKNANHELVESLLEQAAPSAGSLILLPELFDVGFSMNVDKLSEQATDNASENWCAAIAKSRKLYIQGASINKYPAEQKAVNCAAVYNPDGQMICRYEKIFPFTAGAEGKYYQSGTEIKTYQWNGLTVCPFICYDLRFPELWRIAVLDYKVEIFTIGASWPAIRHDHWLKLLEARAIENQAWVVGCNRCGKDPNLAYAGGTSIITPHGHVAARADDLTKIINHDIVKDSIKRWRADFKALEDIRPQMLGKVL